MTGSGAGGSTPRRLGAAALAVLTFAGMLDACGARPVASVLCAAQVRFAGRIYTGPGDNGSGRLDVVPITHRTRIGDGVYPRCGPPSNGVPARTVGIYRISGVGVATAVAVDDGQVWLVPGARLPVSVATAPWMTSIAP